MAYYGITSQSQIIDVSTISTGCSQLEAAAEKFSQCANIIETASSICDAKALAVEKTTMQPQLEADAQYIRSIGESIKSFAVAIRSVAAQVYAAQDNEYRNYLAELEAQKANQSNG